MKKKEHENYMTHDYFLFVIGLSTVLLHKNDNCDD